MDEVTRYRFEELCPTGETMVMGSDFDAALAREAALREELAQSRKEFGVQKGKLNSMILHCKSLDDGLAAAEQRNSGRDELLRIIHKDYRDEIGSALWELIDAALKPTESGAGE